ncbi:MAG TPA: TIGR03067 domain-containing protein, partial [Gemmataceae bacterium]|nr:TIGR03067 domain-containing protein [Gemmataceae bacterium]
MRILACILILAVVATVPAKPVRQPPPETKPDQELVQGDWIPISATKDNDKIPQEKLNRSVFTFKGNEILITEKTANADKPRIERATFKFDSTKKPKQLEIQPVQI